MDEKRIAVAAIVIDELSAAIEVNNVLHEFSDVIIGRMDIPYRERGISLISVAIDAKPNVISSLTGKLGRISGVSVKTAIYKGNTAQSPPDGFALNLLAYFPSSCTEIP